MSYEFTVHLLLSHNCFIKRKLPIMVHIVLTDVNILPSIVLANTYIWDSNKAYHFPTNGVYNINKCQCSLTSILYHHAFLNLFSMQTFKSARRGLYGDALHIPPKQSPWFLSENQVNPKRATLQRERTNTSSMNAGICFHASPCGMYINRSCTSIKSLGSLTTG